MSKIHVMIFPAGEINSVELNRSLAHIVNIDLYGASSVNRHGEYIFKNYRGNLPLINDSRFIESFNELLKEWNIDIIFPTHDSVALFLIENRNLINAKIIGSDLETAQICRDKLRTYNVLSEYDFIPKLYYNTDTYPCFIKPRVGQGSQNARVVHSKEDLLDNESLEECIISEYLPGEELSVDCLTDVDGKLLCAYPRTRERLMSGIAVSSSAAECTDEIIYIAEQINKKLNFLGLWYFQIKKDINGKYKLLEISTRCPSTMCLTRARGINLPLLSVYIGMGRKVSVFDNDYDVKVDRTLINRYSSNIDFDTIYVDYDDTIVEKENVCVLVIAFLYQCKNKGKRVVMLSRHEVYNNDSLYDNMTKHNISKELFDEIINVSLNEEKSDYIKTSSSIFIDNAYSEREKVHRKNHIPVFDIEGIEVLMDWRV